MLSDALQASRDAVWTYLLLGKKKKQTNFSILKKQSQTLNTVAPSFDQFCNRLFRFHFNFRFVWIAVWIIQITARYVWHHSLNIIETISILILSKIQRYCLCQDVTHHVFLRWQ